MDEKEGLHILLDSYNDDPTLKDQLVEKYVEEYHPVKKKMSGEDKIFVFTALSGLLCFAFLGIYVAADVIVTMGINGLLLDIGVIGTILTIIATIMVNNPNPNP